MPVPPVLDEPSEEQDCFTAIFAPGPLLLQEIGLTHHGQMLPSLARGSAETFADEVEGEDVAGDDADEPLIL
eukprot:1107926-Prorocentrum_lima.AAC.1